MRRLRLAIVLASLALGACSLLTSLDGLGPAADGGKDVVGPVDSSADAGDAEASGPDATCDGYCACLFPPAVLCEDFDEDAGLQGPFSAINSSGNATGSIDQTLFVSPPASGGFHFQASGSGQYELTYTAVSSVVTATVESRIQIPTRPPSNTNYGFALFELEFPSQSISIDYGIRDNELDDIIVECYSCQASLNYVEYDLTNYLPPGAWVDVKMQVTFGSQTTVTMTYDGASVGGVPANIYHFGAMQPTFVLGAVFQGGSPALDVYFDNVTLDYATTLDAGTD